MTLLLVVLPLWSPIPGPVLDTPSGNTLQAMPPHPDRLRQWLQEGRPLPPFLTDPTFFARKGINRPSSSPSQLAGPINALAVVVDFNDNVHTVTASFFDTLIFALPVAGRGSVRDYYSEVSYGQVDIVTVNLPSSLGWQRAPSLYSYYVNNNYCWGSYPQNCQRLAEDIVDAINGVVDFSNYDNDGDGLMEPIMLIHAGRGAEFTGNPNDIWSHSWSLHTPRNYDGVTIANYVIMPEYWVTVSPVTSDMTIGVFAHEMGHGFWGLPDLYDYDNSSYGIGTWSLMSYGSWNGPNSGGWGPDGSSPAWPDAWCRIAMGFDTYRTILGPVEATFLPVETNQNAIVRFKSTTLQSLEYFLAENREQILGSYDEYLPGSGLLIWHVDDALRSLYGPNSNECRTIPHCSGACVSTHYLVALEQADGADHLEFHNNIGDAGDPFPGLSGRTYWRPYPTVPANPESGSWYDSGCALDSCIDLTNIACTPLSNCTATVNRAACSEAEADLGDAPASQNNHGNIPMTAYPAFPPWPAVTAAFPTVYLPLASTGPRHHFSQVDSWLGTAVTGESNADWLPDQDGQTNISPTIDLADTDSIATPTGFDDGLSPLTVLLPCQPFPLVYTVTVASSGPVFPRYVNAWFDWNHDGDWNDTLTCPGGQPAPEWAVQDQVLLLGQGIHPGLASPPFFPWLTIRENAPFEVWMRLSLAEQPAPAPQDGRGPAQGYDFGETEDYLLLLSPWIEKEAEVTETLPGSAVNYHIRYGGQGNVIAGNAVISDVLPQGIEYLSSDPPGTYNPSSRTVTWPANIVPGQSTALTLTVQVTGSPSQTVTNTAYLLWGDAIWVRDSFAFHIAPLPGDPHADFTWSVPACVSQTVYFTNLSSGTQPISYQWDLDGDGIPDSTATDPTWHYAAPGPYTVTLTATNAFRSNIRSKVITLTQGLDGLSIAGPTSLLVGQAATYTAVPAPPNATSPLFTWDNGTSGITTTYRWDTPGLYTIVVTGSNACSLVTGTLEVWVSSECISLTGVSIAGPTSLLVGQAATYTAVPAPPNATSPLFTWDNGTSGITTTYRWDTPGLYTIVVTGSNACSLVTGTLEVWVSSECISLTGVSIAGPASLLPGEEGIYLAMPEPISATAPAYLWSNGSTTASAVYSWTLPGRYTVTVTATNCLNVIVRGHLPVLVRPVFRIYLPLVLRSG